MYCYCTTVVVLEHSGTLTHKLTINKVERAAVVSNAASNQESPGIKFCLGLYWVDHPLLAGCNIVHLLCQMFSLKHSFSLFIVFTGFLQHNAPVIKFSKIKTSKAKNQNSESLVRENTMMMMMMTYLLQISCISLSMKKVLF